MTRGAGRAAPSQHALLEDDVAVPADGRAELLVLACGAIAREVLALIALNDWEHVDVRCLPAKLHSRPHLIAPAERLRSVTVAIPHDAERKVEVRFGLKTEEAGQSLRAALLERFAREPIEVTGEGATCRVETPFVPKRIGSMISRLIPDKR